MTDRLRVHWVTREHDVVGNAYGYNVHNRSLKKWCAELMDFDTDARIAVTITPADQFSPIPAKINVLFTMWEFLDLPESYIKKINDPGLDAIVVPCAFCRDVFRKYTDKPIYVCHLGVDPDTFKFMPRSFPRRPDKFRFLWIGAPNPRKGYPLVLEAVKIFEHCPDVEMYIKTTAPKINWWQAIKNTWKFRRDIFSSETRKTAFLKALRHIPRPDISGKVRAFGKYKNIIFDTRKLSFEDLKKLYGSAHCFLLPTFGEGWGLTLCEAMATGCPSIATPVTGCADFFNSDTGIPIRYSVAKQELRNYNLIADGYIPDTRSFIQAMMYVVSNYADALKRGEKASRRINSAFTWDQSAYRMNQILKDVLKSQAKRTK
jgi:hypothetical protein